MVWAFIFLCFYIKEWEYGETKENKETKENNEKSPGRRAWPPRKKFCLGRARVLRSKTSNEPNCVKGGGWVAQCDLWVLESNFVTRFLFPGINFDNVLVIL